MTTLALRMPLVQVSLGVSLGTVAPVSQWLARWRERQAMLELEDEQLTDVGLSREAILAEANKPFWAA